MIVGDRKDSAGKSRISGLSEFEMFFGQKGFAVKSILFKLILFQTLHPQALRPCASSTGIGSGLSFAFRALFWCDPIRHNPGLAIEHEDRTKNARRKDHQ